MDTCNQKYQRTYQLVMRQETSYMIIYQENIFKYILIILLNKCESNKI